MAYNYDGGQKDRETDDQLLRSLPDREKKMAKYALFNGTDWICDVHAESAEDAVAKNPPANRAELISESDDEGKAGR